MPNKEVDDFLSEVKDDFTDDNKDFSLDNEVETKKQDESPAEEEKTEKVPFHKDPKVQKYVEREIAKRMEDIEKRIDEVKSSSKVNEDEVDDFYVRLLGNETPEQKSLAKEFKSRDQQLLQQAEERAYRKLVEERESTSQAEREAEETLNNALEEIEETYNIDFSKDAVAKKNKVDFLNFVQKISPKDSNGEIIAYPDMMSAYETFQEMKKTPSNTRAKELSSRSMSRAGDATTNPLEERITFDNIDELLKRAHN